MATRSQRRSTAAERDARRREQLEQLRQATTVLLTSEGWQRWLRTRSRFHRYSLRNTLLIAFQCPQATYVAGFRRWLELGRCVRKGEKKTNCTAEHGYSHAVACTLAAAALQSGRRVMFDEKSREIK